MSHTNTEVRKKYRNVHTGKVCRVSNKIFYTITYYNEGKPNNPKYIHYKTFRKNWDVVE